MQNDVKTLINILFEKLNINIDSIEINDINESNNIHVKIKTSESWLLIWPHWKNFDSIQSLLKIMCSKIIWEKIKLSLEINDYMKTKDDRLFDFIKHKIDYLNKNSKEIILPFYSSYERRKIHWFVHKLNKSWIFTKSVWEWKERRLHIYKEIVSKKLTIDIDWSDI